MEDRLANEILDCKYRWCSQKREDTHKMAEATKHLLTTVGKMKAFTLSVFRYMVYQ